MRNRVINAYRAQNVKHSIRRFLSHFATGKIMRGWSFNICKQLDSVEPLQHSRKIFLIAECLDHASTKMRVQIYGSTRTTISLDY